MQIAAYEAEQEKCTEHAGPRSECEDPERPWFAHRIVCHARMAEAVANWRYDALHESAPYHNGTFEEWSNVRSDDFPFHFRDGVTLIVAPEDHAPDDKFLSGNSGTDTEAGGD